MQDVRYQRGRKHKNNRERKDQRIRKDANEIETHVEEIQDLKGKVQ